MKQALTQPLSKLSLVVVASVSGILLFVKLLTLGHPPVFDTTEARYADIAQQMILGGDWITPRLAGTLQPFLGKPPLAFWASAVAYQWFGCNEWAARLPNMLEGFITLIICYNISRKRYSCSIALLATLLLFSAGMFVIISASVSMDMLVCMTTALGVWAVELSATAWQTGRKNRQWAADACLGLSAGLGMLSKGPVAIILMIGPILLSVMGDKRRWATLAHIRWWWATLIALAIALPWYLAAQHANPDFFQYFFINENLLRYIKPEYGDRYGSGHHHPYGTSWAFMLLGFMPWSLCLPWVWQHSWQQYRKPMEPESHLCGPVISLGAWAVFAPLFFTFARSIVFPYLLSSLPALAIQTAAWLDSRGVSLSSTGLGKVRTKSFLVVMALVSLSVSLWYGLGNDDVYSAKSTHRLVKQVNRLSHPFTLSALPVRWFKEPPPFSWYFYRLQPVVNCRLSGKPSLQGRSNKPMLALGKPFLAIVKNDKATAFRQSMHVAQADYKAVLTSSPYHVYLVHTHSLPTGISPYE